MTASAAERLDGVVREHGDWAPYVAVLRETAAVLASGDARHEGRGVAASVVCTLAPTSPDVPRLHGASIAVDGRLLERWVRRLLRVAAEHGAAAAVGDAAHSGDLDAASLVEAAIADDAARAGAVASATGAEPAALFAVAQVAIIPVLDACRRAHVTGLPSHWPHGSCPLCGAWAALAEARGLDRALSLRCARCAADWTAEWLHCAFCGNRDHATLGSLVPDGAVESRRVEVCDRCRGYVKTLTTLTAIPVAEVALEDLATVDLDLVAIARGYAKPPRPTPLDARIVITDRARPWSAWDLGGLLRRA